jgi:hypothetical protein
LHFATYGFRQFDVVRGIWLGLFAKKVPKEKDNQEKFKESANKLVNRVVSFCQLRTVIATCTGTGRLDASA